MPANTTVERFVVEAGKGIEALVQFYAQSATMQENASPPRVGKEALLKYEQAAQDSLKNLKATCLRPKFTQMQPHCPGHLAR